MSELDISSFIMGFFSAVLVNLIIQYVRHLFRRVEIRYEKSLELEQSAEIEKSGSAIEAIKYRKFYRRKRFATIVSVVGIAVFFGFVIFLRDSVANIPEWLQVLVVLGTFSLLIIGFAVSFALFDDWVWRAHPRGNPHRVKRRNSQRR
jgi:uncharacterized membrane protein (DUF485 family)